MNSAAFTAVPTIHCSLQIFRTLLHTVKRKGRNYYNETIVTIAGVYLFTRLTNVIITEINNYDLGVSGRG